MYKLMNCIQPLTSHRSNVRTGASQNSPYHHTPYLDPRSWPKDRSFASPKCSTIFSLPTNPYTVSHGRVINTKNPQVSNGNRKGVALKDHPVWCETSDQNYQVSCRSTKFCNSIGMRYVNYLFSYIIYRILSLRQSVSWWKFFFDSNGNFLY